MQDKGPPSAKLIAHDILIGVHVNGSNLLSPIATSDPQFVATRGHLEQSLILYKNEGLLVMTGA